MDGHAHHLYQLTVETGSCVSYKSIPPVERSGYTETAIDGFNITASLVIVVKLSCFRALICYCYVEMKLLLMSFPKLRWKVEGGRCSERNDINIKAKSISSKKRIVDLITCLDIYRPSCLLVVCLQVLLTAETLLDLIMEAS